MNDEQLRLSDELLEVMRNAGRYAQQVREPFVTARALLLALLDDPEVGPALVDLVPREKVLALPPSDDLRARANRVDEKALPRGEAALVPRYDTLAFKQIDTMKNTWLSREAYTIFVEGANRAEKGLYKPKHLGFGLAAEAIRSPGVLAALRIEPGKLTDALYAG